MRFRRTFRLPMAVFALVAFALTLTQLTPRASGETDKNARADSAVIRVAPPAPVVSDEARLSELAARRARVAEKIGPTGVLILFSAEPRVYTNDVDYEYRQENNLYYLTNLKQRGATLVLLPGNTQTPEILFLPRRDPAAETWTGHMYSPEEARMLSGIGEIWESSEFEPFMTAMRARQAYRPKDESLLMTRESAASTRPVTPPVPQAAQSTAAADAATPARTSANQTPSNVQTTNANATTPRQTPTQTPSAQGRNVSNTSAATSDSGPTGFETIFAAAAQGQADLYLLVPRDNGREAESREYRQEQKFASQWARTSSGFSIHDAWPIFIEMRLRKSPMELQMLQHAIDITGEGFGRAMAMANRAQWEYEVDAEIAYTFKRRNADHWGYPSIVGCGPNATTLHYVESQGRIKQGDLLLMDVGAEYNHYTADITRTFPVNGKFTPEQAEIYNIVYNAQEAAARASRPGATIMDVHNASTEVIKDGLLRLGLITERDSNQYRIWFMHGNSHWLGMNVHDVGTRETKFAPGMTFTNEPGIYVREDALDYLPKTPENEKFITAVRPAFEKYKNIGVRIEDDMLITDDGVKWMTAAIPRSIADIESFIARASREMRAESAPVELFKRGSWMAALAGFSEQQDMTARVLEFRRWQPASFQPFPAAQTMRTP